MHVHAHVQIQIPDTCHASSRPLWSLCVLTAKGLPATSLGSSSPSLFFSLLNELKILSTPPPPPTPIHMSIHTATLQHSRVTARPRQVTSRHITSLHVTSPQAQHGTPWARAMSHGPRATHFGRSMPKRKAEGRGTRKAAWDTEGRGAWDAVHGTRRHNASTCSPSAFVLEAPMPGGR